MSDQDDKAKSAGQKVTNTDQTELPHLSSLFYRGGLAPAVLVDGCERREGLEND